MATRKAAKTTRGTKSTSAIRTRKVATARKATKANGAAPVFSPEQVTQVLELIKGANSVELKLSVPMVSHQATIRAIGLDPVEAQPRQAFFFDTPDLAVNRAGLMMKTLADVEDLDPAAFDALYDDAMRNDLY